MASIELTKEEYEDLLVLANIGIWVVTAHREENEEAEDRLDALNDKLLAKAADFGAEDAVIYDEDLEANVASDDIDHKSFSYITEYDAENFWEDLTFKMAERDAAKELNVEEIDVDALPEEELEKHLEIMTKHEEKWLQAFEEKGIDALFDA